MNDCTKIENNLIFFYYKELNKEKMEQINVHLLNCSKCEILYNQLANSLSVIDIEKNTDIDLLLTNKIIEQVLLVEKNKKGKNNSVVFKKLIQTTLTVAAISVGIFFGVFIGGFYESANIANSNFEQTEVFYFNDLEQEAFLSEIINNE